MIRDLMRWMGKKSSALDYQYVGCRREAFMIRQKKLIDANYFSQSHAVLQSPFHITARVSGASIISYFFWLWVHLNFEKIVGGYDIFLAFSPEKANCSAFESCVPHKHLNLIIAAFHIFSFFHAIKAHKVAQDSLRWIIEGVHLWWQPWLAITWMSVKLLWMAIFRRHNDINFKTFLHFHFGTLKAL